MNASKICHQLADLEISHPKYEQSFNLTHSHLAVAQEGSVVILTGPTRVGKTTLTGALVKSLARATTEITASVPVVRIDATTTDQGFMSMRYLKLRILEELGHPLLHPESRYQPRLSLSESSAQLMINRAFEALGTKFLIIDEAHHLLETKNQRLVGSALDNIKCIGNECGVVILLSGGYKLLNACFDSAHLNGRLALVNFSRYRPTASELHHFDRILVTLDELLPWSNGCSLIKHRDFIYEGAPGCYGLVQGWVIRALATMSGMGSSRLKISHFIHSRYKEQLQAIRTEIEMGESLLTRFEEPGSESRASGLPKLVRRRGRTQPGVRKPKRDKVEEVL